MLEDWGMSIMEENSIAFYQIGQTPFIYEWEICLKKKQNPRFYPVSVLMRHSSVDPRNLYFWEYPRLLG